MSSRISASRSELKKKVIEIVNTPAPEDLAESIMDLPDAFEAAFSRARSGVRLHAIHDHKYLTSATGGIRLGGLTLICGPSGFGKTTFLASLWMAFHAMGFPIFAAPIENGKEDFMEIIVSALVKKARGDLSVEVWEKTKREHAAFFSNRRHVFSNHEGRVDHLDLLTEIYYAYLTKGTKIAFADTWQFLLAISSAKESFFQAEKAFHEIVRFTKHVPIHLFMTMHPNKEGLERVESQAAVKGSTSSIQEAHNILFFNPLGDKENPPLFVEHAFCREVEISKARYNGRAKGTKILYYIDPSCEFYKESKIL